MGSVKGPDSSAECTGAVAVSRPLSCPLSSAVPPPEVSSTAGPCTVVSTLGSVPVVGFGSALLRPLSGELDVDAGETRLEPAAPVSENMSHTAGDRGVIGLVRLALFCSLCERSVTSWNNSESSPASLMKSSIPISL